MAYGRLDVFGPDSLIKTFSLSSPSVSVGRSAGNTVMLDNNSISRYHFSITLDGEDIYITDLESANGTFVDGVRLVSNERRLLGGGEEVQIGNLRMVFHLMDDASTQPTPPVIEVTRRIESADADFAVDLHGPEQAVSPGAHISAELSITNMTAEDHRYTIEVSGLPKEWVRVDRPTPFVEANDSTFVLVNFKPLRRSESQPGNYKVTIRVFPQEKPEAIIETNLTLSVLPYSGFGVALQSTRVHSGERFHLHLHNQGSANLPLNIYARELASNSLDFSILVPTVTLTPGQQLTIQGNIKARKSTLIGQSRQYPFDVIVHANNHAGFVTAVRGYFLDKPLLPNWAPILLIAVVGMVGLLLSGLLAAFILRPTPEPNFAAVQISSTQVAAGDPLEISWQATDVTEYRLSINGTPVRAASDPQATAFADVDTTGYSGEVTLLLEGFNGDVSTSQQQTIQVYEPVRGVERFVVTPQQLVRYVEQTLTIEWNVPGAVETRLTGLENFSGMALEASGPQGLFDGIVGIARDPLSLTLIARDVAGNVLEEPLTINVVNPECSPSGGEITLYSGPDARQQVIGTIPSGTVVVVNAQDTTGRWLRVLLSGNQNGWGQVEQFVCAGNFEISALFTETNVPALLPTLTPTLAPPPTLAPLPTLTPILTATPLG